MAISARLGAIVFIFTSSSTSPSRWPGRIALGSLAFLVLGQVLLRLMRRADPRPMPSRLAPVLTMPLRSRLFGTPQRVLDRAGVMLGMRVLEIGPGPGVYTIPLV